MVGAIVTLGICIVIASVIYRFACELQLQQTPQNKPLPIEKEIFDEPKPQLKYYNNTYPSQYAKF